MKTFSEIFRPVPAVRIPPAMKVCTKCGLLLLLSEFYVAGGRAIARCKNCFLAGAKKYREVNKGKHRDRAKAYARRNKEKVAAYQKSYRAKHRTRLAVEKRAWQKSNRKRLATYLAKYNRDRRRHDPAYSVIGNLRNRVYQLLERERKSAVTLKLLGCSAVEVKKHLEKLFRPGMTWENYGRFGWHVDHITPCAKFDLTDPEQQKKCFHYTNLQPLWWYENLSKGDK